MYESKLLACFDKHTAILQTEISGRLPKRGGIGLASASRSPVLANHSFLIDAALQSSPFPILYVPGEYLPGEQVWESKLINHVCRQIDYYNKAAK